MPSASGRVARAAVVTHGKAATIGPALARLQALAADAGVQLVVPPEEAAKHGMPPVAGDAAAVDIAVVLGGDGTMLRALTRYLGTGVPVIGVNFGRVGFLSSMTHDELETGIGRVFEGEYDVVELGYSIGGEDLGIQRCDGLICSSPSGSTAYNLSNGGPVLVWGIDAMAITFVAPHSLHARPLVVPRGRDVVICNRTPDVAAVVLVDGHRTGEIRPVDGTVVVRLGPERSLLATLPDATFVRRYRQSFAT